jgi:hypothetical protein
MNQDSIGGWVSGMFDGEGHFKLGFNRQETKTLVLRIRCYASIEINLRNDDIGVLEIIKSYMKCGTIYTQHAPQWGPNANPQAKWRASSWGHLHLNILPHFDKFPLQSKKNNDFIIWREAINFALSLEKHKYWTDDNVEVFGLYKSMLEQCRMYPSTLPKQFMLETTG